MQHPLGRLWLSGQLSACVWTYVFVDFVSAFICICVSSSISSCAYEVAVANGPDSDSVSGLSVLSSHFGCYDAETMLRNDD